MNDHEEVTPEESKEDGQVNIPVELSEEDQTKLLEKIKKLNIKNSSNLFKRQTTGQNRVGVTKANKKLSKAREDMAKNSRKKNAQIAKKKFKASGSKKRK